MDEGWRALLDETFRANIEKQLRTIRSKGGAVDLTPHGRSLLEHARQMLASSR